MLRRSLSFALLLAAPAALAAQASTFDATRYGIVYALPGSRDVRVHLDVPYLVVGRDTLSLDVYVPPGLRPGEVRGAVLFVNGIGDQRPDRVKRWRVYTSWPRVVAASGLIGISMDASRDSVHRSIAAALDFITSTRGRRLGIDTNRVGLYAASANVRATLAYLNDAARSPAIRAAALYYGQPPTGAVPIVPTQFIVAQGDVPGLRPALDSLWKQVVDSSAPWSLIFGRELPHAFDVFTDSDDARRLIRGSLEFWRNYLTPVPPFTSPPDEPPLARRVIEGFFANQPARSIDPLRQWIRDHPRDAVALERLGFALSAAQRRDEAEDAYRRSLAIDSARAQTHAGLGTLYINMSRWEHAVGSLERAVALGMGNAGMLSQLGFAYLGAQRNEDGARAYERALRAGMPNRQQTAVASYNLACAYARLRRTDDAIAMLERAVENGMTNRQQFESDPDLAPLRDDPRFQRLLERLSG